MWIWDTAPADGMQAPVNYDIAHTITITAGRVGANTENVYIDWIAGFDYGQPSANQVFVGTSGVFDKSSSTVAAPAAVTTRIYCNTINNEVKAAVDRLTDYYGMPIFFIPDMYGWTDAEMQADKVHPSIQGNTRIARTVQQYLTAAI